MDTEKIKKAGDRAEWKFESGDFRKSGGSHKNGDFNESGDFGKSDGSDKYGDSGESVREYDI